MGDKKKRMCKWKKDEIEDGFKEYCAVVHSPKYVCTKCGRVADTDKRLCKPKKIPA